MQLGERDAGGTQRRGLADHEHALALLARGIDLHERSAAFPEQPLGGHAQASEQEVIERGTLLVEPGVPPPQVTALGSEIAAEGRVDAAVRVTGRALNQDRALAGESLSLKNRPDGSALHAFAREEIGRAHEHADLDAERRQWRRQRRHHRRRAAVVNAARE